MIRLQVNIPTEISLSEEQAYEVTECVLLRLIKLSKDTKTDYFIDDNFLIIRSDYGHHRGGISEDKVRVATDLDKLVFNVLNKLKK